MGAKKNSEIIYNDSDVLLDVNDKAIKEIELRIIEKKKEFSDKDYSIKTTKSEFAYFKDYMENSVEWTNMEALGVIEINKVIASITKDGIKDNYIFMKSLPLQASHYFLSRRKGKGNKEASEYMAVLVSFDDAIKRESNDSMVIKDLESQLTALQQGINME